MNETRLLLVSALELEFPAIPNDSVVLTNPERAEYDEREAATQSLFAGRSWREMSSLEIGEHVLNLPLLTPLAKERTIPAYLRALVLGELTIDIDDELLGWLEMEIIPGEEGLDIWWGKMRPSQKSVVGLIIFYSSWLNESMPPRRLVRHLYRELFGVVPPVRGSGQCF